MSVPFVDLLSLHKTIEPELHQVFSRVLGNSSFVLGPEVQRFEEEYACYVGTEHCIAVNNGTSALQLSLAALGVGPGDEVITVPHTFIATAEAITAVGARPVFVDIDPETFTMDPELLKDAITSKTKAILPVHLYGQMCDMDAILSVAGRQGIPVVEDACQAHGASYKGRMAGSIGVAGCFSFYPGKNLGALGEGGAITTDDSSLAYRLRILRDHGSCRKYEHTVPGYNMRMEGLQGGMLSVKLKHLDRWNEQRRQAATEYDSAFANTNVTSPKVMDYGRHVFHLYVIMTDNRDALRQHLAHSGIESGLHYPVPLHLQEAYQCLGYREGDFPATERVKDRILSLPMYPGISIAAVAEVAESIQEACYVS
jgi:dTDP-4-amino-4,6-dideoxygalactose transaminase